MIITYVDLKGWFVLLMRILLEKALVVNSGWKRIIIHSLCKQTQNVDNYSAILIHPIIVVDMLTMEIIVLFITSF